MLINNFNLNKTSEKAIKTYIIHDLLDIKVDEYSNYPIFDGDLMVYERPNGNADGFRPIRIQIKGTTSAEDSYTIERHEAKAYLSENGVIFFTVFFKKIDDKNYDEKDYVITYNSLTKNTLKRLLADDKRKRFELKMQKVPTDINEFYKICNNFLIDKSLQTNYIDCSELLKNKPIKEIIMKSTITPKCENKIYEILSDNLKYPRTLMIKFEDGTEQILSDAKMYCWSSSTDFIIKVRDKVFYNKVDNVNLQNKNFLIFGNSFKIIYSPIYEFEYSLDGNIYQNIHDIEFLLAVYENNGFELNDKHLVLTFTEDVYKVLKSKIKQLQIIKEVSKTIGFNSDLKPNNITQKEFSDVLMLYFKKVEKTGIYTLSLAQKLGLVFVDKDLNYKNFFEASNNLIWKLKLDNGKEIENISPFITLKRDSLEKYDNIDYTKIEESIFNQKINDETLTLTNQFVLELIEYYDKIKKVSILESAKNITRWLLKNDNSDYIRINLCQINKRLNKKLTEIEINDLIRIKNETSDNLIKCAVCILLESKIEFQTIFKQLKETEQEQLKNFPIYYLLSDTN